MLQGTETGSRCKCGCHPLSLKSVQEDKLEPFSIIHTCTLFSVFKYMIFKRWGKRNVRKIWKMYCKLMLFHDNYSASCLNIKSCMHTELTRLLYKRSSSTLMKSNLLARSQATKRSTELSLHYFLRYISLPHKILYFGI